MKKALSLTEVLISILLITVVIASLLQIKSNNFYLLEKSNDQEIFNSYLSIVSASKIKNDKNIWIDSLVNFNNDEIRKELKDKKFTVKIEDEDPIILKGDDESGISITLDILKVKISLNNKSKIFYRIKEKSK